MSIVLGVALLVVYAVISVSGLTLMKASDGVVLSMKMAVGFGLYGLGFVIFYWILTRLPMSVAFPIAASSLIIGTQVAGYAFFGESMSLFHVLGLVCIIVGIVLIYVMGGST